MTKANDKPAPRTARELIRAKAAVDAARRQLKNTGLFTDEDCWGAVIHALVDKGRELQAEIEALTAALQGPRDGIELKPGAEVDAPRHRVFGGVIKKIKGRVAFVDIYEATGGMITRRFELADLEAVKAKPAE